MCAAILMATELRAVERGSGDKPKY